MEPISIFGALGLAQPLVKATADLTRALKEPFGSKKIEAMRGDIVSVLEANARTIEALAHRVDSLEAEVAELREWRRLPGWKRLFR